MFILIPALLVGAALVILMHKLPSQVTAYVDGKPVIITVLPIGDGQSLREDAAMAYLAMKEAAARDGVTLYAESGFRTMPAQQRLWERFVAGVGNLAARPGYSNHQGGISVDIRVGGSFTSAAYEWLKAHAADYGWENNGAHFSQPEPWHWTFRGMPEQLSLNPLDELLAAIDNATSTPKGDA